MADAVIELSVHYRVQSVACVITHHIWQPGLATPDYDQLSSKWQGDPQTAFLAVIPGDYRLQKIGMLHVGGTDVPTEAGREVFIDLPGTRGGALGDGLPPNLCQVHTIRTGFRGRRARGRNFWSGAVEQDIDQDGFIGGAPYFGSLVNAYYDKMFQEFVDDVTLTNRWGIWSRRQQEQHGWVDAFRTVTQQVGHALVHELRSRRL